MIVVKGRKVEVIMTRKEELFSYYESVKDRAVCVTLFIKMPTGETEVISNSNIDAKMAYIDKTYDDELVHSGCKQICIEDYAFACMDDAMDFGSAIMNMKEGHKVARKGWTEDNVFLYLTEASIVPFDKLRGNARKFVNRENVGRNNAIICEHIDMKATDGSIICGWQPSQADMLAEDWMVVE